jgi:tRNA A-37 threonylcarbamoyl transferase component Bud32
VNGPDPTLPLPGTPDPQDRTEPSPPGPQSRSTQPTPRQPSEPTDSDRTQILPQIPDVILDRELGRGGMGVVYYGRQPYLDREVAVKLLTDTLRGTEFAARFQREARILAGINHPHIVACYQAGLTKAGDCYLVMEFVDGPNLRHWVDEKGPLSPTEAVTLCRDLAQALGHANDKGVIHRDVKPENVLLMRDKRAPADARFPWITKLADLGLARREASDESIHLTAQGAVMGTPATMAPEQFEDPDHVDFRADMYGLGCILFHVLTSKPAFARGTMASIFKEKSAGKTPDPRREREDLPAPVSRLTRRLLERKKEDRFGSYAELVAECERVLAELRPVPGPEPKRRWPWIAAAVAGVVLVAGGAWWLANGREGSESQPVTDTRRAPPKAILQQTRLAAWPRPSFVAPGLFREGRDRLGAWSKISAKPPVTGGSDEDDEDAVTVLCETGDNGYECHRLPQGTWRLRGIVELRETNIGDKDVLPRHARVRVEVGGSTSLALSFDGREVKPVVAGSWRRIEDGQTADTVEGGTHEVIGKLFVHFLFERTTEGLVLRFAPEHKEAEAQELAIPIPNASARLMITADEGLAAFRDFFLERT